MIDNDRQTINGLRDKMRKRIDGQAMQARSQGTLTNEQTDKKKYLRNSYLRNRTMRYQGFSPEFLTLPSKESTTYEG